MVLLLQIISESVGFSFGRKDKLKRHMDTVHSDAKPFKCDFCSTSFNRRDKLKQHVSSIHSALVLQQQQERSNPFEPGMLTNFQFSLNGFLFLLRTEALTPVGRNTNRFPRGP